MRLRAATTDDAGAVAELLTTAFPGRLAPYIPLMQPGAGRFLETVFAYAQFQPHRNDVVVVGDDANVLAYADFRTRADGTAFLYYICVAPAARGQGIAPRILVEYARRHTGTSRIELDVFADNALALSLYRRLGFVHSGGRTWWARTPPQDAPGGRATVTVDNIPVAVAMQDRYGFCQLEVSREGRTHGVGRIGSTLSYRTREDFEDDALLLALTEVIPPVKSCFLALETDALAPGQGEVLVESLRLQADPAQILEMT